MSSQSVVLLIMGVCGSGKTLLGEMLSKELGFALVDADQYHSESNKKKLSDGIPLTDGDRLPWLNSLSVIINNWLIEGQNGIIACSALKESYRQILITDPHRIHILFLRGPYELFAKRLAKRKHEFMNANLLTSQFEILEEPERAIYLDASLPPKDLLNSACIKLNKLRSEI